jgi:hypothetical protein
MANLVATLKINLTYQAPGGGSVAIPQKSYTVPYGASCAGQLDIPDGTVDGASFDIPFGSIATGATAALIYNGTSFPLELKINGSAVVCEIAAGGAHLICQADLPAGVPLTALAVLATDTTVGVERVEYFVFGDPE